MRNLRWPFLIFCLVAFMAFSPLTGHAQPGDPTDPDAPITGIEILIGLGSLLGIKKLTQKKEHTKD